MDTFAQKAFRVLSEPFSSWDSFVTSATNFVSLVASGQSRTGWPYLLSSVLIAYAVVRLGKRRGYFHAHKSFREIVLPLEVYLHRSAIVDYKFVLFDQSIRKLLYMPLLYGLTHVLYVALSSVLPRGDIYISPRIAAWMLPIVAVILSDFGMFVGHWLMHRIDFLWPFHEVHHSAEVLTPVTVYRVHPVEELVIGAVNSFVTAMSGALFTALTDAPLDPLSIFGLNALTFLFYVTGYQLRHSHVWLSYGPVLSRILISPAQHQVHHSEAEKHWNKNFGFMLAIWDWMLGSLYVPKEREHIVFGCGVDSHEYSTVTKLYFTPFAKSYAAFTRQLRRVVMRLPSHRSPVLDPSCDADRYNTPRDSAV
jgi:sterol desaturase/sphingolipid hydroxylase (fatty acid hydroxylase superfamily)